MKIKNPTSHELDSEKYCQQQGIDVSDFNTYEINGWSIWISYPNGIDRIFKKDLSERLSKRAYWEACVYAAGVWWSVLKERNQVPKLKVPSVPKLKVPSPPKVPKFLKVLSVPKFNG